MNKIKNYIYLDVINEIIAEKGLNLTKIKKKSQLSVGTISNIINKNYKIHSMNLGNIFCLCYGLDINLDYLFYRVEKKHFEIENYSNKPKKENLIDINNQEISITCNACRNKITKTILFIKQNDHLVCFCGHVINLQNTKLKKEIQKIEKAIEKINNL